MLIWRSIRKKQQNTELKIQRATPDDAGVIADMGARTFEAAFGADNRPEDMQQYLSLNFSPARIKEQLSDPAATFLLVCENKKPVGYAVLRVSKNHISKIDPDAVELVRFYVESEIIGRGYGSALMRACLEEALQNGHRTIWLGVWEKNQRAIRFYRKWGFTKMGTQEFILGSDLQRDYVLVRSTETIAERGEIKT
jgi:ribosomal protein S18 acetylase RimI-like enzyme